MPKLLISLPTGDISKELTGDTVMIGRTPDNTVQIDHHSVSAHHARLTLSNGNYRLKDLDSTNRTCVNGAPVSEAELTGSCILRIGTVECVYKVEKVEKAPPPVASDQSQFQMTELQRQMENLMKARDLIHQQNRTLEKERDEARTEAENYLEQLSDAKKLLGQLSSSGEREQLRDFSMKLADSKVQLDTIAREREALLISNQELKSRVVALTAKIKELQGKVTRGAVQQQTAAGVQEQAALRVAAEMDESVEEFEDAELAGAGQKTAAAGGGVGRFISAAPLLGSWLNRGAKRKAGAPEQAEQTGRTAPAPGVQPDTKTVASADMPAATPPSLRMAAPRQEPDAHNANLGNPAVKIGRAPANAVPQNPEIKPVWELLNGMRRSLHYFLRHQDELKVLQEMAESAHRLTEMCGAELLRPIHGLAAALESLVADLHSSPANVNPSTLRTVGQCIDFIATLIHESNLSQIKDVTTARILAIDDDEGILESIKGTMEMVHIDISTATQSAAALDMLSGQNYDMILLDVGLPDMNGMDICSRVRAMPHHQKTPIVFLTGAATVQNKVQSTLNGGNDLIGKPFSVLELAVKVIVWIFKGQLAMV